MNKQERIKAIMKQIEALADEFQAISAEGLPEGEYSDDSIVIVANIKDDDENGHTSIFVHGYDASIFQSFASAYRSDPGLMKICMDAAMNNIAPHFANFSCDENESDAEN